MAVCVVVTMENNASGKIKARERSPSGAVAFLHPAHGQQDVDDCRRWAAGQGY